MSGNRVMLVAKWMQGCRLMKVVDAVKELSVEGSWDCSTMGMSLQCMEISRVALVHVMLLSEGFEIYDCEGDVNVGVCLKRLVVVWC